jgi:subtilisin family serine protease
MRCSSITVLVGILAGLNAWAGDEFPARPGEQVAPNELIIRLRPGAAIGPVLAGFLPGAQVQTLGRERLFRISAPGGIPSGVSTGLANNPLVDFVEPNRVRSAVVTAPNDPDYPTSWWFQTVQALPAWSLLPGQYLTAATAGAGRVKVAVLDTGADCTHPDFINTGGNSADSVLGGQLLFSASQSLVANTLSVPACGGWQDDHGHGTHVTGIVAAATSNALGVSGLAYPVQVIEYKVLDSTGNGFDTDIATAIMAATDAGAQVVSLSLGGAGYSQTLQTAVNYAWQRNTLVVAAAGNSATSALFFPAGANHAIGISATDAGNNLASFSNFGNSVHLAAPGVGILSTAPTYTVTTGWRNYVSLSGTSMATPFVSALAGLVAMSTPNTTAQAILLRLEQTANSSTVGGGWGQNFGYGIINAANAVTGSLRTATNGAVSGQIVNAAGSPITGAQITINGQTVTTTSAALGLFRFSTLPAGTYPVSVSAAGSPAQSLDVTVAPGADAPLTVTMGVTYGKFTGIVSDQSIGVPGAIVQAQSGGLIVAAAVTDLNGHYNLWVPASGTFDVRASAVGRNTQTLSSLTLSTGGTTTANLTLTRMGIIAGTVRDGNLNPVANAQVLVTSASFSAAATTDGSGNYSLIGLPNGTQYSATATATGFLPSTQNGTTVNADVTTSVNFIMVSSTVVTPTFNPPAGTYTGTQNVSISTTTSGASIRYTTDGSTPTSSLGTVYAGSVSVSSSLTLKAIAYKAGMTDSLVASAAYTINTGAPGWYNLSWTNRKAVTIDHTKVSGGSSLANFAVLFSTTDANLKSVANGGSVGKADGTDILFTAGDGSTKLDHELERYNASTGEVIAWVRIPSLANTVDTGLYIYYGNAAAANQQNPTGVWDSSYKGVWHLSNGTVLNAGDSTANANNGSIAGAGARSGEIDGAGSFSGSSQYININNFAITDPYNFTVEAWINPTDFANYDGIVGKTNSYLPAPFDLYLNQGDGKPVFYVGDGGSHYGNLTGTAAPSTGAWSHIVVVASGSPASVTLTQYLNGAANGATTLTNFTAADTNNSIKIASRNDVFTMFKGGIDEVRVSSAPRTAGWVTTEYKNQNSPSTFFAIGVQESSGGVQTVATPAFNPPAGTYTSTQLVTISTTTSGASIRYTTDGSTPTSSVGTLYAGAVSVSSSLTLKAIAYKAGMTDSLVASAAYTINTGAPGWYNLSWTNRKAVTDANLRTVANGGSVGKADGTDILFTAGDGTTKLDHELERYNPSTGEVIAWVRIPSLSNTVDTGLYIYYGNAAAANQQNPTGVWDSGFKGIWHLSNGTVLNAGDSTANANNGSIIGAAARAGEIDGAGSFSGSSQYININNFAITDPYNFTVEAWINPTDYAFYNGIAGKTNSNLPAPFDLYLNQGNGKPVFYVGDGGSSHLGALTGTAAPSTGAWSHIVVVASGSFANLTLTQYLNGAANGATTFTNFTAADTNNSIKIGSRNDVFSMFKGGIDEVRVSSAPRTAGWIATEYSNQNSPSTFLAIGAQQ